MNTTPNLFNPVCVAIRLLPNVVEALHFAKTAFKINNKIFASVDPSGTSLTVKLSLTDQDIFSATSLGAIKPVPNKWGQQGWTIVNLQTVQPDKLTEIIKVAYCYAAPLKLSSLVKLK